MIKLTVLEQKILFEAVSEYKETETYLLYESFDNGYLYEGIASFGAKILKKLAVPLEKSGILSKIKGIFKKEKIIKNELDRINQKIKFVKNQFNKTYDASVKSKLKSSLEKLEKQKIEYMNKGKILNILKNNLKKINSVRKTLFNKIKNIYSQVSNKLDTMIKVRAMKKAMKKPLTKNMASGAKPASSKIKSTAKAVSNKIKSAKDRLKTGVKNVVGTRKGLVAFNIGGAAGLSAGAYVQSIKKKSQEKVKQSMKAVQSGNFRTAIAKLNESLKVKVSALINLVTDKQKLKTFLRSDANKAIAVAGFVAVAALVFALTKPIVVKLMALLNKVINMIGSVIGAGKRISMGFLNSIKNIVKKITK